MRIFTPSGFSLLFRSMSLPAEYRLLSVYPVMVVALKIIV